MKVDKLIKLHLKWKLISHPVLIFAMLGSVVNPLQIGGVNAADLLQGPTQIATSPALPNVVVANPNSAPVYSLNGGLTWQNLATTPWPYATGLKLGVAPRVGMGNPVRILAGQARTLYRTGDYGQTWAQTVLDHAGDCVSDYFDDFIISPADPNRLYVTQICEWAGIFGGSGTDYRILISTDAGQTWAYPRSRYTRKPVPSPIIANRVYAKDVLANTWIQTDDGGSTWITRTFPVDVLALDAQNPNYLYGLAGATGKSSQNGGNTWTSWPIQPCNNSPYIQAQLLVHPNLSNTLFVQCATGLHRSINGGNSWEQMPTGGGIINNFSKSGSIFLSRWDGLWNSEDSGITWSHLTVDYSTPRVTGWRWHKAGSFLSRSDFSSVTQLDALATDNVWAVACNPPNRNFIARWDGQTWLSADEVFLCLTSIDMLSANDGWTVGSYQDFGIHDFYINHWNGSTWTVSFSTTVALKQIDMVSANDGWAVGDAIVRWNGSSWITYSKPVTQTLLSLSMLSSIEGWAVGNEGVITRWKGNSWASVTSPVTQTLRAVKIYSSNLGWAVGDAGTILKWDGIHWFTVTSPTSHRLNAIDVYESDAAWAVGEAGTVLRWDGSEWGLEEAPTQMNLNAVTLVSAEAGWAAGDTHVPLIRYLDTFLPVISR